jgi:hypothetical protein
MYGRLIAVGVDVKSDLGKTWSRVQASGEGYTSSSTYPGQCFSRGTSVP